MATFHLWLIIIAALGCLLTSPSAAQPTQLQSIQDPAINEITGDLNVTCLETAITVNFHTRREFHGRVYVKDGDTAEETLCASDFASNRVSDGTLVLPFDNCPVPMKPMESSFGFSRTMTLIVSFHPTFVTAADRAYRVHCAYDGRHAVTMGARLLVSKLPADSELVVNRMDSCAYTLHKMGRHGPQVVEAEVGDTVYHRWSCAAGDHSLFVHSCFASDNDKSLVQIIDRFGCTRDPILMSNVSYSGDGREAWLETRAFKFHGQTAIRFHCQVDLCLTDEKCAPTAEECARRSEVNGAATQQTPQSGNSGRAARSVEVATNHIEVIDRLALNEIASRDAIDIPNELSLLQRPVNAPSAPSEQNSLDERYDHWRHKYTHFATLLLIVGCAVTATSAAACAVVSLRRVADRAIERVLVV